MRSTVPVGGGRSPRSFGCNVMVHRIAIVVLAACLAGCGVGMPPPTKQKIAVQDIAGAWQYSDALVPGGSVQITFHTNGSFVLKHRFKASGVTLTNTGDWSLSGADLTLRPFWTMSISGPGRLDRHDSARWWVTDWYTKGVAPFGGDSLDPDQWTVLARVEK